MTAAEQRPRGILSRPDFPRLLEALSRAGYCVAGPTVRDGAIVYGEIHDEHDLPIGWTDRQEAGTYRLERRTDAAVFGYNVGPHSWKKFLFPAHERLWTAVRDGASFAIAAEPAETQPWAFLGVRACELAAIGIQDRVFAAGGDRAYAERRRRILRIAVQCGQAGQTCFCASMGTGPQVRQDADLVLTEILSPGPHRFLVEIGSPAGAAVAAELPLAPESAEDAATAAGIVQRTTASMGRRLDLDGIRDLLVDHPEHPRWEIVARRCLACTNCTMACPTCFCQTTEEVPALSGDRVERWRRWDSCFTAGFSEVHGAPVRPSVRGRYRQWLTHKLGTWNDQFGTSGCVGCGRCITWCPVGIDITEEVAEIRAAPEARPPGGSPP